MCGETNKEYNSGNLLSETLPPGYADACRTRRGRSRTNKYQGNLRTQKSPTREIANTYNDIDLESGFKLSPRRKLEIFVPRFDLCTLTEAAVEAMSAQGTQGEVDPLVRVGHEILGANDGAQVIQLTQVEIAQIVSNAVSQALPHQIQQLGNSLPSTTAANPVTQNTSAAQQFQPPIKFDVPAFEGDSTASWLTWSQRVLYQARASGFENELTAAVGDGLSVGADVFDSSNVDPVRLRNAHAAWMILINSCSRMALEIVQRSDAPNEA